MKYFFCCLSSCSCFFGFGDFSRWNPTCHRVCFSDFLGTPTWQWKFSQRNSWFIELDDGNIYSTGNPDQFHGVKTHIVSGVDFPNKTNPLIDVPMKTFNGEICECFWGASTASVQPPIWPILNSKSNPRSLLARRAIRQNGGSPDPQQPVEAWLLMMDHQYTVYGYWGMVINPLIGIYKPILKV